MNSFIHATGTRSTLARRYRRTARRVAIAVALCALAPAVGTASIYRSVPVPAPSLLPDGIGSGAHAPLRHLTVNGSPVEARTWSAHASMAEIREAVHQTVQHEYDAYQAAVRKNPKYDRDRSHYFSLPRVVLASSWLGVLRVGAGGAARAGASRRGAAAPVPQTSQVSLILPASSPSDWTVWESAMPTREAFRLMTRDASTDAPGRDHPKAGRPSGSVRTFSLEETLSGARNFSATYASGLSPLAAGGEVVQHLLGNGFRVRRKSEANGQLLAELQDSVAEVTVYAAAAASGQASQVVVAVRERAQ